jgi:ABC-type nitrate/sulfonate/bicarbonate transport system permease component
MLRAFKFVVLALPLLLASSACDSAIDDIPTTPDPVTVTETFSGNININGAATHTFFTSATGTVTATLTSLGENPPAQVGFSIGTFAGSSCSLLITNDKAVVTSIVSGVVTTLGGSLCVRIYDVGSLTESVPYEIRIEHK